MAEHVKPDLLVKDFDAFVPIVPLREFIARVIYKTLILICKQTETLNNADVGNLRLNLSRNHRYNKIALFRYKYFIFLVSFLLSFANSQTLKFKRSTLAVARS